MSSPAIPIQTPRFGAPTCSDYKSRNLNLPFIHYIFKYNMEMEKKWDEFKCSIQTSRDWPAHFVQYPRDTQTNNEIEPSSVHDVLGLFMETDSESSPSSRKRPRSSQDGNEENRTLMDAKRSKTDSIIDSSAAKTDKVRGGVGYIENIPPINPVLSSTTDMELD